MAKAQRLPRIAFQKQVLPNGVVVIAIPVKDTSLAAVNLLYRTGSKDESADMTGLAHLMEHLMFSGTDKYPAFDLPITRVGGVNNAFTGQDFTNYYIVLPKNSFELALDLESDRISHLRLDQKSISVQKNVVLEEFRQRYLNQPYGDHYHLLYAAAYRQHHYRWPTIGLSVDHVENVTDETVKKFYNAHYNPSNLIVAVAGDLNSKEVFKLASKYFGNIPSVSTDRVKIPAEPEQNRKQIKVVHRTVPSSLLTIAYPIPGVAYPEFTGFGFLADILGQGIISRLHMALVKEKRYFTRISAYITGSVDPGLFVVSGMLHDDVDPAVATDAVQEIVQQFVETGPTASEMKSMLNGMLTSTLMKRQNVMQLAMECAITEMEEGVEKVNDLFDRYRMMNKGLLMHLAAQYLVAENRIEIHYLKK